MLAAAIAFVLAQMIVSVTHVPSLDGEVSAAVEAAACFQHDHAETCHDPAEHEHHLQALVSSPGSEPGIGGAELTAAQRPALSGRAGERLRRPPRPA